MRLKRIAMKAEKIAMPMIRSRSGLDNAVKNAGPSPGHEKMVSVITEPLSSAAKSSAQSVTKGIRALRNACFQTTFRSESPFARAVRM